MNDVALEDLRLSNRQEMRENSLLLHTHEHSFPSSWNSRGKTDKECQLCIESLLASSHRISVTVTDKKKEGKRGNPLCYRIWFLSIVFCVFSLSASLSVSHSMCIYFLVDRDWEKKDCQEREKRVFRSEQTQNIIPWSEQLKSAIQFQLWSEEVKKRSEDQLEQLKVQNRIHWDSSE